MLKNMKKEQENNVEEKKPEENSVVAEFVEESKRFKEKSRSIPKKGEGREEMVN